MSCSADASRFQRPEIRDARPDRAHALERGAGPERRPAERRVRPELRQFVERGDGCDTVVRPAVLQRQMLQRAESRQLGEARPRGVAVSKNMAADAKPLPPERYRRNGQLAIPRRPCDPQPFQTRQVGQRVGVRDDRHPDQQEFADVRQRGSCANFRGRDDALDRWVRGEAIEIDERHAEPVTAGGKDLTIAGLNALDRNQMARITERRPGASEVVEGQCADVARALASLEIGQPIESSLSAALAHGARSCHMEENLLRG